MHNLFGCPVLAILNLARKLRTQLSPSLGRIEEVFGKNVLFLASLEIQKVKKVAKMYYERFHKCVIDGPSNVSWRQAVFAQKQLTESKKHRNLIENVFFGVRE